MPLEEIKKYISISLKLLSLGLIIAAGGFWAGAGVDSRPKYRDEQTLVAGTIWSQILIPIGLLISTIVNEELEHFIHGYFLVTGLILKFSTGIVLGKFNLRLDVFEGCKGPKTNDCCNITIHRINQTAVDYDVRLNRPMTLTKGKVTARSNGSDFFRLQLKNPCNHIFMKSILQTALNITRTCVINPGHYHMIADINNIAQSYYGGSFLFGTFHFRSLFLAEDCNFSCTDVVVTFVPKKP
ncbi:uncharacterized protein LOC135072968 [Ostrinia nubilalis]|uniref:uncharacterized protein LOC135072968 n=1 Tax=Ostrinia nubilalis TaxID=29057 RepID=UPI00308242A6